MNAREEFIESLAGIGRSPVGIYDTLAADNARLREALTIIKGDGCDFSSKPEQFCDAMQEPKLCSGCVARIALSGAK